MQLLLLSLQSSKVNVFERHLPQVFESHQPANLVSTDSQDQRMMAPYVPPQVTIFYDPLPSSSDVHEVVTTRERESFFHFESFYSELPMTHGESHPYAGEMYHANEFNSALTAFIKSSILPSDLASSLESAASVVETPPPELSSLGEASDGKDGLLEFRSEEDAVVTAAEETCLTSSKVQLSAAESEDVAEMAFATEDVRGVVIMTRVINLSRHTNDKTMICFDVVLLFINFFNFLVNG